LEPIELKEGRIFDTTKLRKAWMTACAGCGSGRKTEVPDKPNGAILSKKRAGSSRKTIDGAIV
jgi:hypothetical protein